MTFKVPETFRNRHGIMGSDASYGNNGAFIVHAITLQQTLNCIASDWEGWEHVSVSLPDRAPTWDEMSFIRDLFWGRDDLVVQFHPPHDEYVNNHEYCLHLWRKKGGNGFCETPPGILVGVKELGRVSA